MNKGEAEKIPVKTVSGEVIQNQMFSEDNFMLELTRPEEFIYRAGQFVMIHINGNQKPFSIASAPEERNLKFLIKEHKEGIVTPFLMNLKSGDKINITGPFGVYGIKDTNKRLFFVAAGTGVAPFRGMILSYLERFPKARITLIFGFRNDFYFEEDFKKMSEMHPNFEIISSCTGIEPTFKCLRGRVTDHLAELIKDSNDKEVYICGPREMVENCRNILVSQLKFDKNQIRVEEW